MWCCAVWRGYCIGRGIVGGFLLLFVVGVLGLVFWAAFEQKVFYIKGLRIFI